MFSQPVATLFESPSDFCDVVFTQAQVEHLRSNVIVQK